MVRPACKCQLQASGTRQITDHASVHKRHSAHDPRTADERRVPRRQPSSLTREQSVVSSASLRTQILIGWVISRGG